MRIPAIFLLLAALAPGEIIDRVAVSLDQEVITDSEVRQALRVAAFLSGEEPDFGPASRRQMAERLVDQILMRRDMRFTRYPEPPATEIEERLQAIRTQLGGDSQFQQALRRGGLGLEHLRGALARQVAVLHYIDLRFRPEVQVLEPELLEYFNNVCLPDYRKRNPNGPEPNFDDLRAECEERMQGERVDQRVEQWLKEVRGRARIEFQEDAFK